MDDDPLELAPRPPARMPALDAGAHALAAASSWYRDACYRTLPKKHRSIAGALVATVLLGTFLAFLGILLSHRVYLADDSAVSYAHVWFIAERLYSGHGIPLRMPDLEAGHAFTFPYGLLPWLPTALVRPLLGDWAVTASMVVGVGLLMVGIWRWLPRTASPLMTGLILLNWQLWNGILQFQLATIWAFAFACLATAEFDRAHPRRGAVLAVAALVAHPAMGTGALAVLLLASVEAVRRLPRAHVAGLALAIAVTLPTTWMFLHTPSMSEAATWSPLVTAHVMAQRVSLLVWPWLIQRWMSVTVRLHTPALLLGAVLLFHNVEHSNPRNLRWHSLPRFPDFLAAQMLDPGGRYRVLTMSNQEDGMVQLMRAGGVLAQEFFDESIYRHSFRSADSYRCFLARKSVNHVLVSSQWVKRGYTNELDLLDQLVGRGQARLVFQGYAGTLDYAVDTPPLSMCHVKKA